MCNHQPFFSKTVTFAQNYLLIKMDKQDLKFWVDAIGNWSLFGCSCYIRFDCAHTVFDLSTIAALHCKKSKQLSKQVSGTFWPYIEIIEQTWPKRGPRLHAALQLIFAALGTFYHLEMIVWHCVLIKFLDEIFKIYTYFMSKMTKQWKYDEFFLLCRSFTYKNTFLKNEALTQFFFQIWPLNKKVWPPLL